MVKNLPAMQETEVYLWVRRSPGERNGKPLQYSCLENPMDRGGWRSTVYGVTKNLIELNGKKKKKKRELNDKRLYFHFSKIDLIFAKKLTEQNLSHIFNYSTHHSLHVQ